MATRFSAYRFLDTLSGTMIVKVLSTLALTFVVLLGVPYVLLSLPSFVVLAGVAVTFLLVGRTLLG